MANIRMPPAAFHVFQDILVSVCQSGCRYVTSALRCTTRASVVKEVISAWSGSWRSTSGGLTEVKQRVGFRLRLMITSTLDNGQLGFSGSHNEQRRDLCSMTADRIESIS